MDTENEASGQYCTFTVADLHFGVTVQNVREVLRSHELAPVPLAPDAIEGLLNLRGQIVTAIDLRRRLGLAPRQEGAPAMLLVMQDGDSVVAFMADAVGDVIDISAHEFDPPPPTMRGSAKDLVTGVCKLSGKLLHLLDTEKAALVGCS